MATAKDVDDLADELENLKVSSNAGGQYRFISPDCAGQDAQITVLHKNKSELFKLDDIPAPLFHFLVQAQKKTFKDIVLKCKFKFVDYAISTSVLTVQYDGQNDQFDERKEDFKRRIASACESYEIRSFDVDDNVLSLVLEQFYETSKEAFNDGSIQIIRRYKDSKFYCLVGVIGIFEEQFSILDKHIKQCKLVRVQNKELLEVLQIEQKLLKFPKVQVFVSSEHLILNGERNEIQECASFIQTLSRPERCTRVVSENMYKFLEMENVRPAIDSCLMLAGYPISWKVTKEKKTCGLICRGISYDPKKAADFLTNQLLKEFDFSKEYLRYLPEKFEMYINGKIFESPKEDSCALVYYGSTSSLEQSVKDDRNFWFDRKVYMHEILEILSVPCVRKCIETKLKGKFKNWDIQKEMFVVGVLCQSLSEAESIASQILSQVCCVSKPAETCQINPIITQFCKMHSDWVQIKKESDFWTFYIMADLKNELEKMFITSTKEVDPDTVNVGKNNQTFTKTTTILFTEEILRFLRNKCSDELKKIAKDIGIDISIKKESLELKAKSETEILEAKESLLALLKSISCQREKSRIRIDYDSTMIKKVIEKVEEERSCTFSLSKIVHEPSYLHCWDTQCFRIVTVEGGLASIESDLLICFLDENWQPRGNSSEKIFMTDIWPEVEEAAKRLRIDQKNPKSKPPKCKFISSRNAGFLKSKQILFASSRNLTGDMGEIWSHVLQEVTNNQLCSICLPVEPAQITNGSLNALLSILAKGVSTQLLYNLELQLCIMDEDGSLKVKVHDICHQHLEKKFCSLDFHVDDQYHGEGKGLHSLIEVKIEKGTFLDAAKKLKVDVIVNSTNTALDLKKGFVSSLILKEGGQELQDEVKKKYGRGIGYGKIAATPFKSTASQTIFHGALYERSNSRKPSLKVLKCLITRCLLQMKKEGYKTIAFPALGTGKLGYSYISVAKAMKETLIEFGKQNPDTFVETVYIILHEKEKQCIQVFEDVFECFATTTDTGFSDILLKPEIMFWECRLSENGILIQLLSEETGEPIDAVVKVSSNAKTGGGVDLKWCSSIECYRTQMNVSTENHHLKEMVWQCFRMFSDKKVTSARIDIKECKPDIYDQVFESFRKVLSKLPSSSNVDTSLPNYSLRKLQFLTSKKEYQRILQIDPNSTFKFSLSLSSIGVQRKDFKWREVKMKQRRDVLVSVLGSSSEQVKKALADFKEMAVLENSETGNWCFFDHLQWKFVPRITNIQLNKAVEEGQISKDIKEEDGTCHSYDLISMNRSPSNPGDVDVFPERILCLPDFGERTTLCQEDEFWYVNQGDKWIILPKQTRSMLSETKSRKRNTTSDSRHDYDLKNWKRKQKGKHFEEEEIMVVEAFHKVNKDAEVVYAESNPQMRPMAQIFESVSGTLSYGKGHTCTRPENEVRRELTNLGCSVTSQGENYFRILGNLSQIRDLSEWVMKTEKEKSVDSNNYVNVAFIPMSHREYKTLEHFANQRQWFKKCWNSMKFEGHGLTFDCLTDDEKKIEEDIKKRLEEVKMMTCISTEITDESKDLIKELAEKYPNVCLVVNDRIVDIISDSYEDVLKLQDMLKPKAPVKSNRRAARTFAKAEDTENQGALSSSNDGYNAEGNAFKTSTFTSQPNTQSGALELKTAEGFIIKIYTGSITRLNVDCIVNAANENLMHGGGVAAAISEAAGYQFDQESAQYIADNGPIPVGSCCVTSAGKLPYKCVIHTVGPRWSGYRDSNVCLELLQKSVEVSFKTADMEGMNSVAIPAISSGIFGVPRDKCVEQYYKAAMSFCSTYPCKSLREIHFVDRDESMVRAIQTVFESKEPIKTSNDIKNTESANGNDESSILNKKEEMPPTENSYTIVTVSDSLQIKLHMGSITDIVADVIVCPQEKFCTSNNQIARDIFRKDPGSKPTPGKREIGDIFSRIPAETSPWKEIIHAVFPIYNEEYSKDPINFGKTFNAMLQEIFRKADNGKFTAIAVPFFIKDKDGYKAPVYWCALDFLTAVTSKGKTLKDIYIVVQNEDDEKTFLDACKANRYEITPRSLIQPKRLGTDQDFGKTLTNKPDKEDNCCICMDTPTNPKRLKCGHIYCKECIEQQFAYKPACPSCGQIYGKMTGDQPPGTISIRKDRQTLQGVFDSKGCILLTYSFSSGYQGEENPHPGQWYKGIQRSGYVPNNERGRLVAKLLNVAFSRRLVFTIGRSRTTGEDGVITWNDIHHKTRHYGGSEKFGYPDPTYLDRVLEELAAKGVTPESADDPQEYTEYSRAMRF